MKMYLGLDNQPILNGEYKVLKAVDYLFEFVAVMNFKDGILHGEQKRLDKEGLIVEINIYDNGNLIETKQNVNSDRYVDEMALENQRYKRTGNYILYANNETSIFTLKKGLFQNNKWIFNDNPNFEKPILLSIENFVDNHHVGEQVFFHENGEIMLIEYYRNSTSHLPEKSTWFDYDENGNLYAERNFRNNKKDGRHIFYNKEGKIIKDISYRDGKLYGPSTYYREDGSKLIIEYEFGFQIGEKIEY